MARRKSPANEPGNTLRELALRHPGVDEGVACEGTVIEKRTLKVGGKAFLFLGPRDAMLKLRESLSEATRLEKAEPERYRAGAGGWVKVSFVPDAPADLALLAKWIAESHRVLAGAASGPARRKRAPAKKARARQKAPKPRGR
jgi:hypothetical protein